MPATFDTTPLFGADASARDSAVKALASQAKNDGPQLFADIDFSAALVKVSDKRPMQPSKRRGAD